MARSCKSYYIKENPHKVSHTDKKQTGMGDFYGTGMKAKLGRVRDAYGPIITPVSKKGLKTPPKSVV